MFNFKSKLGITEGLASISSHAAFGWLTLTLQRVEQSYDCGSLLNQEASNAFPLFHYWKPCPIEHYYQTAILNFYRYLLKEKCHTITGIRAVFINIQYASKLYNNYDFTEKRSGVHFLHSTSRVVSVTPAPHVYEIGKRIK